VALKVLHPRLAPGARARRRFLREARAMAAVEHDHVVPVHEVGEDRGVPFLAMPLLRGETLAERLARAAAAGPAARLTPAEVLRVGREIAEGLAAAHARGLVHRDIKPGNIWLETRGEPGASATGARVKILDFGLARPGEGAAPLTETGALVGTPAYMAPEQARGEHVDERSDLFSLGCVLYQLCTGRPPFAGGNPLAVLSALATQAPQPVRDLNAAVPPPLAELVMQLLAKDPAGRPASAREVADRLAVVERQPAADLPTPAHRLPRPRRRAVVAALVAAGLAAAAGAAILLGARLGTGGGTEADGPPPGERHPALTVRALRVLHWAAGGKVMVPRGELGVRSFATRFNDQVQVEAELSEPAYWYLIVFNTNGTEQLHVPADEKAPPTRRDRLAADPKRALTLDDGVGVQALVLVASRRALPAYAAWKARRPPVAWPVQQPVPGVVWRDDGAGLYALLPTGERRGRVGELRGVPPLDALCRRLRAAPGVEVVSGIAFPVLPEADGR
jgi:hypothetical protein